MWCYAFFEESVINECHVVLPNFNAFVLFNMLFFGPYNHICDPMGVL